MGKHRGKWDCRGRRQREKCKEERTALRAHLVTVACKKGVPKSDERIVHA